MNKFYDHHMPYTPSAHLSPRVPGHRIIPSATLRVLSAVDAVGPDEDLPEVEWSVGAVAERLGIPTATLRSWDRRYGVGPSQRSAGGHRRYTENDILRVGVLQRHVDRGVPTQTAARVALAMDVQRLEREASPQA